jgi:Primase C terminal 1 (PriCT-1)
MNYPDFKYVEVAVNGANNRNKIHNVRALGDPKGLRETYMTYFRYSEEMIDHFQERKTVSGFKGEAYSDWLPIDIDSPDLQEAQDNLNLLVQRLEDYEIDSNCCRFFFSGSKGFHVMIPSQIISAEPKEDIHKRFRKVAIHLSKGINIDTSIYDKTRIFRLPNTINAKSNLYKIELYPFQALSTNIEEILHMAKQPVESLEIEEEYEVNEELSEVFHSSLQQAKSVSNESVEGVKVKLCMKSLMEGVGEGERDNVGVRVAAHLKSSGLTKKMMWSALNEWNDSNDPPLYVYELERIFEQGLREYEFGCHDHLLKRHCDKRCLFYKEEWGRF